MLCGLESNAQNWSPAGSLVFPRFSGAAVRLTNGQVLLVGGHSATSGAIADVEIYSPETNSWRSATTMNGPRNIPTATMLRNGRVLVTGGDDNSGVTYWLSSAELYDPVSDTWTATGSMHQSRGMQTATRLLDGRVLVVGGSGDGVGFLSSAEVYDPNTGLWGSVGSMGKARAHHSATLLRDGRVLVVGGAGVTSHSDAELYDPVSNVWSSAGTMSSSRSGHSATLLLDGRVLVAGGSNGVPPYVVSSAELYDPATNSWTVAGSMRDERDGHSATLLYDGTVLVAGGAGITYGPFATYWSTSELYSPSTNSWTDGGNMAVAKPVPVATLLSNGKVLLVGRATAEIYTPATLPASSSPESVPTVSPLGLLAMSLLLGGLSVVWLRRAS